MTVKRAFGGKKIKWLKISDLAAEAAEGALEPERADRVLSGDLGGRKEGRREPVTAGESFANAK